MAISTTYLVLQSQIADELGGRTDLLSVLSGSGLALSPIKNAIQSAIAKWEREPFYFNEVYESSTPFFTTVSGTEFYAAAADADIATAPSIYALHALIAGNRWTLTPRTWAYLDEMAVQPTGRGQPSDWAYFAQQFRLYPIPDGAYPIRASRTQRVAALSADGDTNIWTSEGFDLIRSEAKLILAQEVTHDAGLAAEMKLAIYGDPQIPASRGYLRALKAETTRRGGRGRIRPTQF